MNYLFIFHGKPLLPKQSLANYCEDIRPPSSKTPFSKEAIRCYNQHTIDFNKSSDRAGQEFILDQRHRFFVAMG